MDKTSLIKFDYNDYILGKYNNLKIRTWRGDEVNILGTYKVLNSERVIAKVIIDRDVEEVHFYSLDGKLLEKFCSSEVFDLYVDNTKDYWINLRIKDESIPEILGVYESEDESINNNPDKNYSLKINLPKTV